MIYDILQVVLFFVVSILFLLALVLYIGGQWVVIGAVLNLLFGGG